MQHLLRVCLCLPLLAGVSLADENRTAPPRMSNGRIDLQGVWSHTNLTPFERPSDFKSRTITAEQALAYKQKMDARLNDLSRPAEPSWFFDDRDVEAIGGELRSSIVTDPATGTIPGNARFKDIVASANAAVLKDFDGPERRPGSERCLSAVSAAPPVQLTPAGDLRRMVQTDTTLVIASEELHETRIVRMNASHSPAHVSSWLGDSIGWWEGDTLVVETKHFSAASMLRQGPNVTFVISPSATVTERFTRVSTSEMRYAFTVRDPDFYTQEWSGETRFVLSDARMHEYACHEGNYSLEFALRSARNLEAASQVPLRSVSTGGALTTE